MKPLIGITAEVDDGGRFARGYAGKKIVHLWSAYLEAVGDAGGAAVLLAPAKDPGDIDLILGRLDGILLTGSAKDVPPSFYGEKIIKAAKVRPMPERSAFEKELVLKAAKAGIPVLGICGGAQIINVAFGGTLFQDIKFQCKTSVKHAASGKGPALHEVNIQGDTLLSEMLFPRPVHKPKRIIVNSSHHQAVKKAGSGLRVSARAADGVIEAIESEKGFVLGVQWHPERMYQDNSRQFSLIRKFLRRAKG